MTFLQTKRAMASSIRSSFPVKQNPSSLSIPVAGIFEKMLLLIGKIHFTVQKKAEQPTQEVTEDPDIPTTPDVDPTDAPVGEAGYYLVGTLNGESLWSEAPFTADRKLKGPDADGFYTLDWTFYMDDELKVAHYDGTEVISKAK